MKRADLHTRLSYAVAWIHGRSDLRPRAGIVLGSGLGAFAKRLERATVIPCAEIPEFPVPRVAGHPGRLVVGEIAAGGGRVPVAVLQGRVHVYEGWGAEDASFGARTLCQLGIEALVLTNAAGAIRADLEPGDLVRITDHINLSGQNPLTGPNDERLGPRFPDLSGAYDPALGERLEACARRLGISLGTGVYACMAGPSYETPAEIRMLRTLGADLVGMSTVPEVIAACHQRVPVCAVSVVSNKAAGLSERPLAHTDVEEVGKRVEERLGSLLAAFLGEMAGIPRPGP
jgi:purine-nucleoside phosphorylase